MAIADFFVRHIPRPIENLTVGWFDGNHSTICRRELSRSDRQVSAPLPADLETSGITFQPWKVSIRLPRVPRKVVEGFLATNSGYGNSLFARKLAHDRRIEFSISWPATSTVTGVVI